MGKRLFALLGIVLALGGLFVASAAKDDGAFVAGMLFTLFGVFVNFWLIAQDDHVPAGKPVETPEEDHPPLVAAAE